MLIISTLLFILLIYILIVCKNLNDYSDETCSVLHVIDILAKKWVVNIISELLVQKEIFFSDLQERLVNKFGESISGRTLSQALKQLEQYNLCKRFVDTETRRVSYSLTEKGYDLEIILAVMKGFSLKWEKILFKKCESFICVHNSVPIIDIDSIKEFAVIK